MPTGAKNVLYIRDLGMATYNLLNFKMRLVYEKRGYPLRCAGWVAHAFAFLKKD